MLMHCFGIQTNSNVAGGLAFHSLSLHFSLSSFSLSLSLPLLFFPVFWCFLLSTHMQFFTRKSVFSFHQSTKRERERKKERKTERERKRVKFHVVSSHVKLKEGENGNDSCLTFLPILYLFFILFLTEREREKGRER